MNKIGMKIDEVRIDGSMKKFQQDLAALEAMGLEAVELPVHGLDAILKGALSRRRMDEVLEILSDFRFVYSVHSPNPMNLMDRAEPDLHADLLWSSLEFARQTGARAVVVHPGRFIPEEQFSLFPSRDITGEEKQRLLEHEARVLRNAADHYPDVQIALENARPYLSQSPYAYAETLEGLKGQVDRVNRKNVRINLDFGHLAMSATFYGFDPVAAVAPVKDLVVHTHIHDNFGGVVHHFQKQQTHQLPLGKGDNHMPVGWGTIPIREILAQVLPGYQGLLMMELRSRYFESVEESRDNLAELVRQIRPAADAA